MYNFNIRQQRIEAQHFSPSRTATLSKLRLMFIGATIVHVFVLGSYLSTELSELWAAPDVRSNNSYFKPNLNKKMLCTPTLILKIICRA